MKKIILLLVILFLSTSCYDYRELNNINIINSIGIDYDNGDYIVYIEVIKSSRKNESNEEKTMIIKGNNSNIAEAFKDAIKKSDKEVYLKQSRLLMLSEKLCKNGIMDVISYLLNDNTLSNNYFLVIVKDMEELEQKNEQSIANAIINKLKNNYDNKKIDDIEKIAGDLLNINKDIALPLISFVNNNVDMSKIGYFDEDKLVNYIDNKIYNFIIKDRNDIEFCFDNNMVSVYKKKIKYDIQDDKVVMNVIGYGYANLINDKYDFKNNDSYEEIQYLLNEKIRDEIKVFLDNTLNDNSDLISIKDLYYKKYRKVLNNIEYEINVDIKIDKNGSLYEGLYD